METTEVEIVRNLDRLNKLLQPLNLPSFRKEVGPSMNNLKWLKSTLLKQECDTELRTLLQMDPKTLLQPYEKFESRA